MTKIIKITKTESVFSIKRSLLSPNISLPNHLKLNQRLKMDGLKMLKELDDACFPIAFLDPQYRGVLNKMSYGNEGVKRGKTRCELAQMESEVICNFVNELDRILMPTAHLFLWMDKFELLNGFRSWLDGTRLEVVDMINWDKGRMGMGYRSRRTTEYCVVLQKHPQRAKGIWKTHNIPDTWREKTPKGRHPHRKPIELQSRLIEAVTNEGDIVIDPAAGDFTVMHAATIQGRHFLGCDTIGEI